jgi:hypothetical protein
MAQVCIGMDRLGTSLCTALSRKCIQSLPSHASRITLIGGRGDTYDLWSGSRNADLCPAFIAVSTVPGMTAETIRADLEQTLTQLKHRDADFEYARVCVSASA